MSRTKPLEPSEAALSCHDKHCIIQAAPAIERMLKYWTSKSNFLNGQRTEYRDLTSVQQSKHPNTLLD